MGSDESHLNVSLIVRDKVTRQRPQTTAFEEKGDPKRIRTEVPLLISLTARPNRLTLQVVFYNIIDFIFSAFSLTLNRVKPFCLGSMLLVFMEHFEAS